MPVLFTALVLLFAAASCQDGIAALPAGMPVLKGLELRPCRDATDSVPAPLLTDAGFAVAPSVVDDPLVLALILLVEFDPAADGRVYELVLVELAGFIL